MNAVLARDMTLDVEGLVTHKFDDPIRQAEFDALTDNEDRIDYIEAAKSIERVKQEGTYTLDELAALLGVD
ncbi:MAG: hypothetical protein NTY51_10690 [Deltaproteobacteria bacterium]|nr:hypothetical protein [Deltaproteobacteria bacterium]